jgi:cytochrome c553
VTRAIVPCIVVLALAALWSARPAARTYENARAVGKRCSTCHDSKHPHLANLNAAGRYYLTHRTLDGYKPSANRSTPSPTGRDANPGRAVFEKSCAVCHGGRGEGTSLAKALTGPRKYATTESAAVEVIRNGIKGTPMAPFAGALSDREIRDVARYVMTLKPRQ